MGVRFVVGLAPSNETISFPATDLSEPSAILETNFCEAARGVLSCCAYSDTVCVTWRLGLAMSRHNGDANMYIEPPLQPRKQYSVSKYFSECASQHTLLWLVVIVGLARCSAAVSPDAIDVHTRLECRDAGGCGAI